jgi:hypothetical protein
MNNIIISYPLQKEFVKKWLREKEREYATRSQGPAAVDSESDEDDHGATAARNEGNPPSNNKNAMSNDDVSSFKTVYVYVFLFHIKSLNISILQFSIFWRMLIE